MDNNENNYQNNEYNNQQMNNNNIEDSGSFGYAVLGFFIPLVGLILFLVWNKNKPKSAKKAGIGALVGFISSIVLSVASIFLATGLIFSNFGSEFSACKEKYGSDYTGVSIKNGVTYCVNNKTKEEKRLDSIEKEPNNIIDNTPSEDETNPQTEDETQQPAQTPDLLGFWFSDKSSYIDISDNKVSTGEYGTDAYINCDYDKIEKLGGNKYVLKTKNCKAPSENLLEESYDEAEDVIIEFTYENKVLKSEDRNYYYIGKTEKEIEEFGNRFSDLFSNSDSSYIDKLLEPYKK